MGDPRTEQDFEAHVMGLLQQLPQASKYHLVMDCLNTHQSEALVRLEAGLEPNLIELLPSQCRIGHRVEEDS